MCGSDYCFPPPFHFQATVCHTWIHLKETEHVFQNSSHFQHWCLYCIYFGHCSLLSPKLCFFSKTRNTTQKSPLKRFVGVIQMQCSPSSDCNWGKQNDPTACWHHLHPQYWVILCNPCSITFMHTHTHTQSCISSFFSCWLLC